MTLIMVGDDLRVSLSTQFTTVLSIVQFFTGLIDNTDVRDGNLAKSSCESKHNTTITLKFK